MKTTRTIIDESGTPRVMEEIYKRGGTMIYEETGATGVVAAFGDYDSLDASATWAANLSELAENHPQFGREVEEIRNN